MPYYGYFGHYYDPRNFSDHSDGKNHMAAYHHPWLSQMHQDPPQTMGRSTVRWWWDAEFRCWWWWDTKTRGWVWQ